MRIALVRHGETEENFNEKIQGRQNNPMNDSGRRQCQRLRDKIRDKDYDICFMSPMVRCVETAMILIGDRVKTVVDDRLLERNMGKLEGRPREEYNAYRFWDYDLNDSRFGVEPVQDIFKRCEDFLNEVKEKYPDQSILVVTHGAPYRALRYLIQGKELKGKLLKSFIKNCQYEEFEI